MVVSKFASGLTRCGGMMVEFKMREVWNIQCGQPLNHSSIPQYSNDIICTFSDAHSLHFTLRQCLVGPTTSVRYTSMLYRTTDTVMA
jgi:hypothetical protein